MSYKEKINLINERINFTKELDKIKEHFRGPEKIIFTNNSWTHPFKHFESSRIYLVLTCFDILGQPDDWKDFNSWLISKNKREERRIIFEKHNNNQIENDIICIHNEYLRIYGVKNSFYRFIREIISIKDRKKLFDSIRCSKISKKDREIISRTGTVYPNFNKEIELTNDKKEKFLFGLRNTFTHKGIPITNGEMGLFDDLMDIDGKKVHGYRKIHEENKNNYIYSYSVSNWPTVLIEVVENTIANNS